MIDNVLMAVDHVLKTQSDAILELKADYRAISDRFAVELGKREALQKEFETYKKNHPAKKVVLPDLIAIL